MNTAANQLSPAYDFGEGDTEISLKRGTASIRVNGAWYHGDGDVKMKFLPMPKIYVHGLFENVDIPFNAAVSCSLFRDEVPSFCFNDMAVEGYLGNPAPKEAGDGVVSLVWRPSITPIAVCGNDATTMIRAKFHVFNFLDFLYHNNKQNHHNEITLTGGGWEVELSPPNVTPENTKSPKEHNGYKLTHVGRIQKTGGSQFTGKDLEECLHALGLVLSFARGDWCEPVCVKGYDESGECVWEKLSPPRSQSFRGNFRWFDEFHAEQLQPFFKCFMEKWKLDDWRNTLLHAIHWYLAANNEYPEAGIILAQAALERLFHQVPVPEERQEKEDVPASKRFHKLFEHFNIPCDMPPYFPCLESIADKKNWDAPRTLTEIRNFLTHPEDRQRILNALDSAKLSVFDAYFEASNLYLWYLEMCILAACGYEGNRLKRRWPREVEAVPWSSEPAPCVAKTCAPSSLASNASCASPSAEPEQNQE